MDATVFHHRIPVNRTNLVPEVGDNLTEDWANDVAQQIVRGAGFAGSVIIPLYSGIKGDRRDYFAGTTIYLPTGAFGTVHPPMVFVMPQYGSVVVYKNFDDQKKTTFYGGDWDPNSGYFGFGQYTETFRTWIDAMSYDEVTEDATVYAQWWFHVKHVCLAPDLRPMYWRSPWVSRDNAWNPLSQQSVIDNEDTQFRDQIAIHWYALGADANSV